MHPDYLNTQQNHEIFFKNIPNLKERKFSTVKKNPLLKYIRSERYFWGVISAVFSTNRFKEIVSITWTMPRFIFFLNIYKISSKGLLLLFYAIYNTCIVNKCSNLEQIQNICMFIVKNIDLCIVMNFGLN